MNAIRRTKPAVSTPNTTARSAQTKSPELRPVLACACSSRYQRQPRIGPPLQRLVDRNGHVVADLADRLDCFPSLVLGVGDDTSDIRTCRHGSILSYGMMCCKTKCGHKSSARERPIDRLADHIGEPRGKARMFNRGNDS